MTRFSRLVASTLVLCGLTTALSSPVLAASEGEDQAAAAEAAEKAESRQAAKQAAPPAAIPGAEGLDEDNGDHVGKDVEPTAALFDAINRGSVSAAKEAVNRGADLEGHNILGQTPLDMSIDLNRNPITFLLLSLRGSDSIRTAGGRSGRRMRASISGGVSGDVDDGDTASYVPSAPARHYDTSGGTTRPSEGFLGFGGS